jgi:hypothetical protein
MLILRSLGERASQPRFYARLARRRVDRPTSERETQATVKSLFAREIQWLWLNVGLAFRNRSTMSLR